MHSQIPYVISGLQHLTALSKYDSNIVLDTQDKDNNQTDKVTDKIIDFQSVKPTILSPHQTSELINVFAITLCGSDHNDSLFSLLQTKSVNFYYENKSASCRREHDEPVGAHRCNLWHPLFIAAREE